MLTMVQWTAYVDPQCPNNARGIAALNSQGLKWAGARRDPPGPAGVHSRQLLFRPGSKILGPVAEMIGRGTLKLCVSCNI